MKKGISQTAAVAVSGVLHYPRLDTVLMVEETLQSCKEWPTKTELWKMLPKKVMYQTFSVIIDYLLELNKITIQNKKIVWIWNPKGVKKYLHSNLIVR